MDGLPIASSVTGLLQASERVTGLLSPEADAHGTSRDVLTAVRALQAIFRRLDGVITPPNQQTTAQKSRIQLCDLVIALTDCVNTFSDLEAKLKELGAGTNGVTLTAWERVGDGGVAAILRHLQVHEASLGLMLSIYSWFVYHPESICRVHPAIACLANTTRPASQQDKRNAKLPS